MISSSAFRLFVVSFNEELKASNYAPYWCELDHVSFNEELKVPSSVSVPPMCSVSFNEELKEQSTTQSLSP